MKNNHLIFSLVPTIFFLFAQAFFCLPATAQVNQVKPLEILIPPVEETFVDVDAVASSRSLGTCPNPFFEITDCFTKYQTDTKRLMFIYNEDGSLWYVYSNHFMESDYWLNTKTGQIKKEDFSPFAQYGVELGIPMYRLIRESKHWYEIEVNEKTRATKFILKSDPYWIKQTWDFWLAKMDFLYFDEYNNIRFYDKPNGKLIEREEGTKFNHLRYLGKRDGDWAFVKVSVNGVYCSNEEVVKGQCYNGWFRWRDGREIFIKKSANVLFKKKELDAIGSVKNSG